MEKAEIIDALEQGLKKYKSSPQKAGDPRTDTVLKALDKPIIAGLTAIDLDPYKNPDVVEWGFKAEGPEYIKAVERLIGELRKAKTPTDEETAEHG